MRRVGYFFVMFVLFFSLVAFCLAAPQDTIIGNWQGDIDSYLADPATKADLEQQSSEDKELFISFNQLVYEVLKVDITKDTMVLDIGFPEKELSKYTIINSTDNSITINAVGKKTEKLLIQIIDEDHLKMYREEENGEMMLNCCLQRVK